MSVSFLPKPWTGRALSWKPDTPADPVLILGYEDAEGEWVVVTASGEIDWVTTPLLRFDEVLS